jgi:hypothetical protein
MNWYTCLMRSKATLRPYIDGEGVLVCDNPLQCWDYCPSSVWAEVWRVLPTGPVEVIDGVGKAPSVLLSRRLERWELSVYATASHGCVTGGQRLLSGGEQKIMVFEDGSVSADGACHVVTYDNGFVNATGNTVVEAYGHSKVVLFGRSRCYAHDSVDVTLIGPDACVTKPAKSKVQVTLIEADPKNVLGDGRYFNVDSDRAYQKTIEDWCKRYEDERFWDKTVPSPIHPPPPVIDPEERANEGRRGLAILFGDTD